MRALGSWHVISSFSVDKVGNEKAHGFLGHFMIQRSEFLPRATRQEVLCITRGQLNGAYSHLGDCEGTNSPKPRKDLQSWYLQP